MSSITGLGDPSSTISTGTSTTTTTTNNNTTTTHTGHHQKSALLVTVQAEGLRVVDVGVPTTTAEPGDKGVRLVILSLSVSVSVPVSFSMFPCGWSPVSGSLRRLVLGSLRMLTRAPTTTPFADSPWIPLTPLIP